MKKVFGFCLVFLFFGVALGFSQTRYTCRELIYDGVNYTRNVRSVTVTEEPGWFTSIEIIFTDGRAIGVEWNEDTKVRAPRGDNFSCRASIYFCRDNSFLPEKMISGGRNLSTSVDYIPGRAYGVVISNYPSGIAASINIVR
jgi:hypothetical protein